MEEFILNAEPRSEFGSRAANRLRQAGFVPTNVYGHGEKNLSCVLKEKDFRNFFEAGHRVATIQIGDKAEHGVVKEVQYDALGSDFVHVDFARIDPNETITMEVAIRPLGVPKGLASGGVQDFPLHELKVQGPANMIPEHIDLDVAELQIGDTIRIKDVATPEGCKFVGDAELLVIGVSAPKGTITEETGEEAPSSDEPEVIGRKKEDGEDASS